jgi:hypothetical protein
VQLMSATFVTPFATIHNYNSRLSGFTREPQNKQFNQAVATPINSTKSKECSASDRLSFGSNFTHLQPKTGTLIDARYLETCLS